MNKIYKAIAKFVPYSPYKIRLLADVVRSKKVLDALNWLESYRTKRSLPLSKVIKSALDNAKNLNSEIKDEEMYISLLKVDQGPMRKYVKPGAQGRSSLLRRRYCHIYVELAKKKLNLNNKKENDGTKG